MNDMDSDLKQYLIDMEARQDTKLGDLESRLNEHIDEAMRTMQTELLRGMERYLAASSLRLRKLEADHSNLDAAISGRMEVLETRLWEIEKRLGIEGLHPGNPTP